MYFSLMARCQKLSFTIASTALLAALTISPAAKAQSLDGECLTKNSSNKPIWECYEISLSSAKSSVTIKHSSGQSFTTPTFDNGTKFRFTPNKSGTWSYDGGTIDISGNRPSYAKGFVSSSNGKWTRTATGEAFVPQYVMYKNLGNLSNSEIANDVKEFVDEHGFTGMHVRGYGDWGKDEFYDNLEQLIINTYRKGGVTHIWFNNDSKSTFLNNAISKNYDTIAARLAPLPGWTMSIGYDVFEWGTNLPEAKAWKSEIQKRSGWKPVLGARGYKNKFSETIPGMDYTSWEFHVKDKSFDKMYNQFRDHVSNNKGRAVFSEDRFRKRGGSGGFGDKDWNNIEDFPSGMWASAMSGGVAAIWGQWKSGKDGHSDPFPQPYKNQIKTYSNFMDRYFTVGMKPDDSMTSKGVCLRDGSKIAICYGEKGFSASDVNKSSISNAAVSSVNTGTGTAVVIASNGSVPKPEVVDTPEPSKPTPVTPPKTETPAPKPAPAPSPTTNNPPAVDKIVTSSSLPFVMQDKGARSLNIGLNATPMGSVMLKMSVSDADNMNEGELLVNGKKAADLFNAKQYGNDEKVDIIIETPASLWKKGDNAVTFKHTDTRGYILHAVSAMVTDTKIEAPEPKKPETQPTERISGTAFKGSLELKNRATKSIIMVLPSAPKEPVTLNMLINDADNMNEGELLINGRKALTLFNDKRYADLRDSEVNITTAAFLWKSGENTITFKHLNTTGYTIKELALSTASNEPIVVENSEQSPEKSSDDSASGSAMLTLEGIDYKGAPVVSLSVNDKVVDLISVKNGKDDYNNFNLKSGDVLKVKYVNDLYDGSFDKDRNINIQGLKMNGKSVDLRKGKASGCSGNRINSATFVSLKCNGTFEIKLP